MLIQKIATIKLLSMNRIKFFVLVRRLTTIEYLSFVKPLNLVRLKSDLAYWISHLLAMANTQRINISAA
jgi:hypothetical protein